MPPPGPTAPTTAELTNPKTARAWKTAQDFEATTLGALLKPMFETVDLSDGPLGGGIGEQTWQPMLVDEYARVMTRHGGIGLAVPVFRQMMQLQEQATQGHRNGAQQ